MSERSFIMNDGREAKARTTMRSVVATTAVVLGAALAGCNHSAKDHSARAAAASTAAATSGATAPGAVNVLPLPGGTASTTPGASTTAATASTTSGASATPGASTTASATPGASTTPGAGTTASATPGTTATAGAPGAGASGTSTASAAAAPVGPGATSLNPRLRGTIPPSLATGFMGSLYLVGERFVPGSYVTVSLNGQQVAALPAAYHASDLLGVTLTLALAGDYAFAVLAPDGTATAPLVVHVPAGSPASLFGLGRPDVQMVYPPALDTSFSGTVWLVGRDFAPGCVVTALSPGLPPQVAPLQFLNDRTVGWTTMSPVAGDITLQVTNPSLQTSQSFTLTVGTPTSTTGAPAVQAPSGVSAPFLGTVHLLGSGYVAGSVAELRPVGAAQPTSRMSLVRVSSAEAWWTLLYPAVGSYELRVVNPGGAASPWTPFDVR